MVILSHCFCSGSNTSAFADDLQLFFTPKPGNIHLCKKILEDFADLSNLRVNYTKSKILQFGTIPTLDFLKAISDIGFSYDTKLDVLGITIDNNLTQIDDNWTKILNRVKKLRNFWGIFNLSLPGRINIIKCYFLSQLLIHLV